MSAPPPANHNHPIVVNSSGERNKAIGAATPKATNITENATVLGRFGTSKLLVVIVLAIWALLVGVLVRLSRVVANCVFRG